MGIGTGPIVGIVIGVLIVGYGISKLAHGSGESTLVSSDQGGGTRRNKKKGTRSSRK